MKEIAQTSNYPEKKAPCILSQTKTNKDNQHVLLKLQI